MLLFLTGKLELFVIVLGGDCSDSDSPEDSGCTSSAVIKSEMSPNSVYLAEVIDADAGATGGSTLVKITRQKYFRKSRIIYRGRWGEGERITLRWETDEILYINENKYVIKDAFGFGGCLSGT